MKKILIPIIFLLYTGPAMSQGWVFVEGLVFSLQDTMPVTNHPVTIMADSANGVVYYNVVLTDSSGYYFDNVPVMTGDPGTLYVRTMDCNNELIQAFFIYDSVNTYFRQDFFICTVNTECEANFSYDSFQFTDLSTGNIYSWLWDFGDGTFSQEQHPYHLFPGPGTYETCLVITGNNCSDTYCNTIMISDTVYGQIYGQVFAGNFPLQYGTVLLFEMNPISGFMTRDESQVDENGIYFFSLVPEGIYLVQAVPFDSNGFLPTYYGDVLSWQQAMPVEMVLPGRQFDISLVTAGPMAPGPGSVSGQINNVNVERAPVDLFNMMLMDENGIAIGFSSVNNQGYFDFGEMGFGTYFLRAELSGVVSDNVRIEITPELPHVDVVLNYSGTSVLGLEETPALENVLSVYPNPFSDRFTLSFNYPGSGMIEISIWSMTGQRVYLEVLSGNAGQKTVSISLSGYPEGLYTLRMRSENGIISAMKILKSR